MKNLQDELHGEKYIDTDERIIRYSLSVLRNKDITELKVRQICDALSLNRATFYAHFDDVFDMFNQIEARMMNDMSHRFLKKISVSLADAVEEILIFIREHKDFYRYYLSHGGNVTLSEDILKGIFPVSNTVEHDHYSQLFMIDGISGVLRCFVLMYDCAQEEQQKVIDCILREVGDYTGNK